MSKSSVSNKLIKVRVYTSGEMYILRPETTQGPTSKSIMIRGGDAAFVQALKLLKATDDEIEPRSKLRLTYGIWLEMFKHGSARFCWVKECLLEAFIKKNGLMPNLTGVKDEQMDQKVTQ